MTLAKTYTVNIHVKEQDENGDGDFTDAEWDIIEDATPTVTALANIIVQLINTLPGREMSVVVDDGFDFERVELNG